MTDDYHPKIVSLPGVRVSPEVVLHRTLGKLDRIKAVTIVIQWDDDTMECDWSTMKTSELCMSSFVLQAQADRELRS